MRKARYTCPRCRSKCRLFDIDLVKCTSCYNITDLYEAMKQAEKHDHNNAFGCQACMNEFLDNRTELISAQGTINSLRNLALQARKPRKIERKERMKYIVVADPFDNAIPHGFQTKRVVYPSLESARRSAESLAATYPGRSYYVAELVGYSRLKNTIYVDLLKEKEIDYKNTEAGNTQEVDPSYRRE